MNKTVEDAVRRMVEYTANEIEQGIQAWVKCNAGEKEKALVEKVSELRAERDEYKALLEKNEGRVKEIVDEHLAEALAREAELRERIQAWKDYVDDNRGQYGELEYMKLTAAPTQPPDAALRRLKKRYMAEGVRRAAKICHEYGFTVLNHIGHERTLEDILETDADEMEKG